MKDTISDEALAFVKKGVNSKDIWKRFSAPCSKSLNKGAFTYFMAGAPGSGKTEIVNKHLVEVFENCIIADADEIRKLIPQYNGSNSHKVHRAASRGIDILYDGALKHGFNILVDGTFALSYKKCRENIVRSLNKDRGVAIFYLYAHPRIAWTYAKKREYTEGRKIRIITFLKAFYKSRENVNKIKKEFGKNVYIVGIKSNYGLGKGIGEIKVNIESVDEIQKVEYSYISLLVRVLYANMLLQKERTLWSIKRLLKK
jgi:predicted ABC-type ATPase